MTTLKKNDFEEPDVEIHISTEEHHQRVIAGIPEFEKLFSNKSDTFLGVYKQPYNFRSSLIKWGRSGFKLISKVGRKKRLTLCDSCEYQKLSFGVSESKLTEVTNGVGIKTCQICGCSIAAKTWIATEKCPLGKW